MQCRRYAEELSIFWISTEGGYMVSTVERHHAGLIVDDEINGYWWWSSLAEATGHEIFHAKEPRRARRIGATSTRPQIDVVPHLDEPQENVTGVRTGVSSGDKGALDVEEDVHLKASAVL